MKTPITYYGGKQNLVSTILPLLPYSNKTHYVEPFFGGGAVFFAKEPHYLETFNDLNNLVYCFYKQIVDDFDALKSNIDGYLHIEQFFKDYINMVKDGSIYKLSQLEKATAFFFLTNYSFASKMNAYGYRIKDTFNIHIKRREELFDKTYYERLKNVQILNRDAHKVITTFDREDTFFYCDPPYYNSVKASTKEYEGYTQENFTELLDILSNIKGRFLLSSYGCELLAEYTKKNSWITKTKDSIVSTTLKTRDKTKTEFLTMNYSLKDNLF